MLAASHDAIAQTPTIARGDVAGTVGWLTVEKREPSQPYDGDDWHNSFFGAISAGWYWTEHLKSELDFGAGTTATAHFTRQITINGRPSFVSTESRFSRRILGISQQYQFFHNVWFHPHVAAGANITRERVTDHIQPIVVFDDPTRGPRTVQPARTEGPRTEITVSPFVATGFKAYVTPRGFFRGDLRVGFRGGIDDVLVRFGFGVDF